MPVVVNIVFYSKNLFLLLLQKNYKNYIFFIEII